MNLEKIKKILKSKKGIVASGVIVGTIVIGIIGGVLVNGASKSNDIAENNKPVINNKKEDNKKDKDESVVSKENNNAEDKKEEVKETESNINMPENSTSSNEIKNNNNDTNKNNSQSSSSNANNNTSNNNSSNTSSNTNSNTSSNTNSNTSNGSTHTHSWNPITEQVHNDEVGHWEDVVVKPAWTESIPVYEDQARDICNTCNADLTGTDIAAHVKKHMMAGEDKGGHRTEWVQVQVGTNSVNHLAVTEKKWVVDKAAWTETVTVGHSCSCGATK